MDKEVEFLQSCQKGNFEDFAGLYDKYLPKIYAYIFHRVRHKEVCEDLTGTVFIKALEQIKKYDADKGSFSAWLYRIARNTVIDYVRGHKIMLDIDEQDVASDENVMSSAEHSLNLKKVEKYMNSLTDEQREVVILRVWDDLTYKEVAQIMNNSESACKMLFLRTIEKMKKDLPLAVLLFLISLK